MQVNGGGKAVGLSRNRQMGEGGDANESGKPGGRETGDQYSAAVPGQPAQCLCQRTCSRHCPASPPLHLY